MWLQSISFMQFTLAVCILCVDLHVSCPLFYRIEPSGQGKYHNDDDRNNKSAESRTIHHGTTVTMTPTITIILVRWMDE